LEELERCKVSNCSIIGPLSVIYLECVCGGLAVKLPSLDHDSIKLILRSCFVTVQHVLINVLPPGVVHILCVSRYMCVSGGRYAINL
jgi:hypothetical protein